MLPRVALALFTAAAVLAPSAAQAKMPAFTVELEPRRPVAGEPLTVIVRPDASLDGFPDRMADLVAFERSGESLPVSLMRSGDVYRAVVTLPSPGRWTVELFPRAYPRPEPHELLRLGYRVPPAAQVGERASAGLLSTAVLAVALAIAAAARAAGP